MGAMTLVDRLVLAPTARRDAVLHVIRSAQRRLVLSVFRCDDFQVLDELVAAIRRDVQVHVLITRRARGWKRRLKELGALLKSAGAQVHRYSGPVKKYHAKYMVADDGPALVGSLNFTRKCFESTCDFMLISHRADVVSSLKALFDNDCRAPRKALVEISDSLIVGPDRSRERLTRLIGEARQSVRIVDHRVTDPEIIHLLKEKNNEGVSVEVLGRGDIGELESHGKMFVVDNAVAVIGSIALSRPSLDFRREVAVIIREPEIITELNAFFGPLAARSSKNLHDLDHLDSWTEWPDDDDDDNGEEDDEAR